MRNVHENYGGKAVCKIVWTRWPQFCLNICKNVNKKYIRVILVIILGDMTMYNSCLLLFCFLVVFRFPVTNIYLFLTNKKNNISEA